MKRFLTGLTLLAALAAATAAPEVIEGAVPLDFDAKATGAAAFEKIYVVTVLYPDLPFSVNSGEMLAKLQREYQARGLRVFGVLGNSPEEVRKFAAGHPEFDFTLCSDPQLKSLDAVTGGKTNAFSRASILNAAGKLLWSGDPVDLAMMLRRIYGREYNERDEIRMSVLNDHLQAALRSGDPAMIEQAADRILAVRPEQISALNAKAFALENARNYPALGEFLKRRIERYPAQPEAYFMLLDLSCRVAQLQDALPEAAAGYYRQFGEDFSGVNAVVWNLLTNAPFRAEALKLAAEGMTRLEALAAKNPPPETLRSRYLATQALYAYRLGDIKRAVILAGESVKAAPNAAEKQFLEGLLDYYRTAQSLGR